MYTILVCDDEKDIVSALNIYLSAEGYRVLTAYDGYQALRLLDREEVHLILLDVMMPGMDGITAMTRLRQSHNLPVILLTAKSEDTDKVLGLNVNHPVFAALKAAQEAGDTEKLNKYSALLYAQAQLIEGLPVDDPAAYAEAVCSLMK